MLQRMIEEALKAYTQAVKEADRFQQQTMKLPPVQQDWDQRNELDSIVRRRQDALLVLIQQAINGGGQ